MLLQENYCVIMFNILSMIDLAMSKHVCSYKKFRYLVVMVHEIWCIDFFGEIYYLCFMDDKAWHLSDSVELFFCLASMKFRFDFIWVGIKKPYGGTIIGAHGSYPRKLSDFN